MKYYTEDELEKMSLEELEAHQIEVEANESTFPDMDDALNEDGWCLVDHQYYEVDLMDLIDIRKEDERITAL